jgi:hypothetical protein
MTGYQSGFAASGNQQKEDFNKDIKLCKWVVVIFLE